MSDKNKAIKLRKRIDFIKENEPALRQILSADSDSSETFIKTRILGRQARMGKIYSKCHSDTAIVKALVKIAHNEIGLSFVIKKHK